LLHSDLLLCLFIWIMFSTAIEPPDPTRSISLLELGAYHHLEGDQLDSSAHVPRDSAFLLSDHISTRPIDHEASYSDHSGTQGALSSSGSYSSGKSPSDHFDTSSPHYHASYPDDQHLPREDHVQYSSRHNIGSRPTLPRASADTSTPVQSMSNPPKPPSDTDTPSAQAPSVPLQTEPKAVSSNPRPRKARREKPHIQLASDQPPTTQGKPRARVYVACIQWCVCICYKLRARR
jgi:hypothetical protein